MSAEQVYDAEIAPLLLRAAQIAQDHGLPLVATVEYAPGEFGTTATLPAEHSHAMAMNLMAVRANAGSGHNSVVLLQMGVPTAAALSPDPLEPSAE